MEYWRSLRAARGIALMKLLNQFGRLSNAGRAFGMLRGRITDALRRKVYPMYIEPEDHLVCKTYMTLGRRRKYETQTLSSSITSENSLLLQINSSS